MAGAAQCPPAIFLSILTDRFQEPELNMSLSTLLLIILLGTVAAYFLGQTRSVQVAKPVGGVRNLAALPSYYASMVSLWAFIPAIFTVLMWLAFDGPIIESLVRGLLPTEAKVLPADELGLILNQIQNVAAGIGTIEMLGQEYLPAVERLAGLNEVSARYMPVLAIIVLVLGLLIGLSAVRAKRNARYSVERIFNITLFVCSSIAIFTTIGIVFSVLFESLRFFEKVPFTEFVFGTHWSPQIAIRADQTGASGSFGVIPLIAGTLLISAIALMISVPVGLMSAIYLAEYASERARSIRASPSAGSSPACSIAGATAALSISIPTRRSPASPSSARKPRRSRANARAWSSSASPPSNVVSRRGWR